MVHLTKKENQEALCDLLDKEGKESLEVSVCREASGKSPKAFWAFRRLGYMLVHQNKWSEAVQSLQHAIRGYPTCAELWQVCLLRFLRLILGVINVFFLSVVLDFAFKMLMIFFSCLRLWGLPTSGWAGILLPLR